MATKTLTITRVLDAPVDMVFKAWTDPKQMAAWWSPKYFTNPVCELDVRPGGAIRIDMTGPDGTVYPMSGEFKEVEAPNRLVFTAIAFKGADGKALLENLNTITFENQGGKTKLTVHVVVLKSEPGTETALASMDEGWSQSLDKLGALIKSAPLIIERTYNAPIERVWSALTNPDEVRQWYFTDFKAEVGYQFTFTGGKNGKNYVHLFKITEVVPGKKLSYTWRYEGVKGDSAVTFELFPEGDRTRLKLTHTGLETFPASNPDLARDRFSGGWTQIIGASLRAFLEK